MMVSSRSSLILHFFQTSAVAGNTSDGSTTFTAMVVVVAVLALIACIVVVVVFRRRKRSMQRYTSPIPAEHERVERHVYSASPAGFQGLASGDALCVHPGDRYIVDLLGSAESSPTSTTYSASETVDEQGAHGSVLLGIDVETAA